jgi:predicted transposase YbfD/YdcC
MNWQDYFPGVSDPRVMGRTDHKLNDILMIALCATISDCDGFEDMADYGRDKHIFLGQFLQLPNGIPSHDTFRRVLSLVQVDQLEAVLRQQATRLVQTLAGQQVCLDGKELRGTIPNGRKHAMVHLLSAWAVEQQQSLGQLRVEGKTNEITLIKPMLASLELADALISIDAIGCQQSIVEQIVGQQAHYLIGLKANQNTLFEQVRDWMLRYNDQPAHYTERSLDHGRAERRQVWVSRELALLDATADWAGLKALVMVRSQRWQGDQVSSTTRFYITSLGQATARQLAGYIRQHWSIENQLHWQLDVVFNEDTSQIRHQLAAQNLALLRKIALSALRRESTLMSLNRKRKKAARDDSYLLQVVQQL